MDIDGVTLRPLDVIPTTGGPVLHMLRADAPGFTTFGEVYFSEVLPGAVKAWKRHSRQTQRLTAPVGLLRFVLHDDRPLSPTCGVTLDIRLGRPDHYALLTIPPGVWYGFSALGTGPALLCNCADLPHDPAESSRRPPADPNLPQVW